MEEAEFCRGSADRPKQPASTVLSIEEEAIVIAFRRHTLLPLDDGLYALQATIPQLTRSSLHRCLKWHGSRGRGRRPGRFILDAIDQMPGLNTKGSTTDRVITDQTWLWWGVAVNRPP